MIHRQKGTIQLECDSCGEICDRTGQEFLDIWNEAKADGWKARKIGDVWVHTCPDCGFTR